MAAGSRISAILDIIVSEAQLLGVFDRVNQHESKSAQGTGVTCEVVWMTGPTPIPSHSGLSSTSGRVVYGVRIMVPLMTSPEDATDALVTQIVDLYINSLHSEISLADAQGSYVDIFGMGGVPIDAQGGYLTIDQTLYRIGTVIVPVIMENIWDQVN